VRLDVLKVMLLKIHVFWDVILCQLRNSSKHSDGTTIFKTSITIYPVILCSIPETLISRGHGINSK
jgi:hypothetical protein